jgi:hypothetical protein
MIAGRTKSGRIRAGFEKSVTQSDKAKSRMYLRMIRAHRPVMKLNDEPDPFQKIMPFEPADKTGGWISCNNGFRR